MTSTRILCDEIVDLCARARVASEQDLQPIMTELIAVVREYTQTLENEVFTRVKAE